MNTAMKVVGIIIAAAIALFGIVVVIEARKPIVPLNVRIEESCRNEFGSRGEAAVIDCVARTSLRYLADQERRKNDAAYDRVR